MTHHTAMPGTPSTRDRTTSLSLNRSAAPLARTTGAAAMTVATWATIPYSSPAAAATTILATTTRPRRGVAKKVCVAVR